ncbi:MAG: PHP domain-containing protein [Candidatus Cloacimonetes bacterium]|nr:PHP domain-containing protein [Candidatus Cloacimonadota bacterium]
MRLYKADLHIHTVLSPCGDLEMSPSAVIKKAIEAGLEIIAITDHNSTKNCSAYIKKGEQAGIVVLPGVEIQTSEEIHLIAVFPNLLIAEKFDRLIYNSLLPIENNPDFFGDQVIIDAEENILGIEERALINSSLWSLDEAVREVRNAGGVCFPAHVDASSYSLLGQLGFIPPDLQFKTLGITAKCKIDRLMAQYPFVKEYQLIRNSDSHYIEQIGTGYSNLYLEKPTFEEIASAINNTDGRFIKPAELS